MASRFAKRPIGFFCLITAFCWFLPCSLNAQSRVLVFHTSQSPLRPGLVEALRIQLSGAASVIESGELPPGALSDRIGRAADRVLERQAALAVWVEGPVELSGGGQELVLYLVGEREGRALVEVLRIPGGAGPEVDRSLALKTREALDGMQQGDAAGMLQRPARQEQDTARPSAWGWIFDLGPVVVAQPGTDLGQWGIGLGAGARLRLGRWSLIGQGLFRLFPRVDIQTDQGEVVGFDELAPGLCLRGVWHAPPFSAGARLGFQLRIVNAEGIARSGLQGSDSSLLAALPAALEAGLQVQSWLSLRLGLGLELDLHRQRFAVNEREVADLGRLRPFAQMAFVFYSP